MYGLENKQRPMVKMDLEKDLEKDPQKFKHLIQSTEEKIQWIKGQLREGSKSADFDALGALLHGYTAMLKVLKKLNTKK